MRTTNKLKVKRDIRVIPEFKEQIDVHKLCKALILAAKENAQKSENPCNTDSK